MGFLTDSCNDGFEVPNPLAACSSIFGGPAPNVDFVDGGRADHGASFNFNFGKLLNDTARSFNIYYGATPDEPGAFAALANVGLTANARVLESAIRKMLSQPLEEVRDIGAEVKLVRRDDMNFAQ